MIDLIGSIDPRDGADRPEDHEVVEEIVGAAAPQQTSMQPVVADDEERVVARADDGDRKEHHPPAGPPGYRQPGGEDAKPAGQRIRRGAPGAQPAQLTQPLRRQEPGAIGLVDPLSYVGPAKRDGHRSALANPAMSILSSWRSVGCCVARMTF